MANFYAKVRQSINDCDISYIEPLSYLKHFAPSGSPADKIVLLYRKGHMSTPTKFKPIKQENDSGQKHMLDLTGSPLKDSCQFDLLNESLSEELQKKNAWNDEDETFQTVPIGDAQLFLNTITKEFDKENTPKCWCICDSNDKKTMLLSTQKKGLKWCRGILYFNGFVDFEPVNLAEVMAKHLSYVVKQYGPIEGMIDNFHNLGRDSMLQVSRPINGLLSQNNAKNDSKMLLHQTVQIHNITRDSSAMNFWIQLVVLDEIKETIVSYKETKDLNCLRFTSYSTDSDIAEIKQEIYDLLTQPITVGLTDAEDGNNNPVTSIDKIITNANNRESGELTDQLWRVLRTCASYEMLKEAIDHIFTSAAKINVVNMPVNQSRLATLIRDISDHRIAIPRLIESEPLELLLEIGLEKLNKDYEYIFTESKLCSSKDLKEDKKSALANDDLNVRKSLKNQFNTNGTAGAAPRKTLMHKLSEHDLNDTKEMVGFQNSQFNLKNIEEDLARLGRIHLILEHLLKIKSNLNLENVFTTFLDELRKPLVPFNVLREMKTDFREFPVTNTKILTKIGHTPFRQRIFLKSRNHFKIIRNTFYYSVDPIFPPYVFHFEDANDEAPKTDVYYAHQYLEIENV